MADQLRARGHDAVIIAPRSREATPERYNGFPVHRITSVPVRQFDVGLPSGEIEDLLAGAAPDVVHVASPFVIGARGLRAAARLDLPTVRSSRPTWRATCGSTRPARPATPPPTRSGAGSAGSTRWPTSPWLPPCRRSPTCAPTFDLFVHTGTRETFGQTIQEACASGLAVVAPRAGGPIDLVTDGENGHLFDPERPGALRDAVCRSLASQHELAELGRRGLERVRGRSWSSVVDRLIQHYEVVAGVRRAGADVVRVPAA